MLNSLYNICITIYAKLVAIASLFNNKARLLNQGQKQTFSYLEQSIEQSQNIIWIHSASLGEFEQGRPIIEHIKREYSQYKILLTFFSPSGYEVRKNYTEADYICYLPFDTQKKASKFIEIVNPKIAFFIKYEFWRNYIEQLNKHNIPLYMVSCTFRPEQIFFKHNIVAKWYRKTLKDIKFYFVQNEKSANLLNNIGINNYKITGDTRFDRVADIAKLNRQLPVIESFKANNKLIVIGSSWQADEEILINVIKSNKYKVIIAPHEIKNSNIERIIKYTDSAIKYTLIDKNSNLETSKLLIIDCIGLLSSIYQYADLAYVGGGFGVGIHNTLEAAMYNIPIVFGPNYKKFNEAVELINRNIAYSISSQKECSHIIEKLLSDNKKRQVIEHECKNFMQENIGATQKIIEKVFNNLNI